MDCVIIPLSIPYTIFQDTLHTLLLKSTLQSIFYTWSFSFSIYKKNRNIYFLFAKCSLKLNIFRHIYNFIRYLYCFGIGTNILITNSICSSYCKHNAYLVNYAILNHNFDWSERMEVIGFVLILSLVWMKLWIILFKHVLP